MTSFSADNAVIGDESARRHAVDSDDHLDDEQPIRCWIAPEIPTAIYRSGAWSCRSDDLHGRLHPAGIDRTRDAPTALLGDRQSRAAKQTGCRRGRHRRR